jgi:hypothetical protein
VATAVADPGQGVVLAEDGHQGTVAVAHPGRERRLQTVGAPLDLKTRLFQLRRQEPSGEPLLEQQLGLLVQLVGHVGQPAGKALHLAPYPLLGALQIRGPHG